MSIADTESRGRIRWVQIDCTDADALSSFWSEVLGMEPDPSEAPPAFRCLQDPHGGIGLCFQRVPEPKVVKNRVHVDVVVSDLERSTQLVRQLGGSVRGEAPDFDEGGWRWRTVADPEGNEFCLVPGRPA
jgi:predicted enzyme related to lactoylglutathione lyase